MKYIIEEHKGTLTYTLRILAKSEVIFENAHYSACAMADGSLIVQKKKTGKGFRLIGENAAVWIDSIKTAIDKSEANDLCRAICS